MAEDEAPKPDASPAATPVPAEPPIAAPEAPLAAPEPLAAAPPPAPPNKLHEWGAALGIMVFLAIVLWVFLNFLRSASL